MRNIVFYLSLCLLLNSPLIHIFAQQPDVIDSLIKKLGQTEDGLDKIKIFNGLSREYRFSYPDTCIFYAEQSLQLAQKLSYKKGQAHSLENLGNAHQMKGMYAEALQYYFQALQLQERLNSKKGISDLYSYISQTYETQGSYPMALDYAIKALKIREELGSKREIADSYNNIGNIYEQQDDNEQALPYFVNALAINEELNDEAGLTRSYHNIGTVFFNLENYVEAREYFFKAMRISEEIGDLQSVAQAWGSIGKVFDLENKDYEALAYYSTALQVSEELSDREGVAHNLTNIANIYLKSGQYGKAIKHGKRSMEISIQIGCKSCIIDASEVLYEVFKSQNNYVDALHYHEVFMNYKDSVFNENKQKELGKLQGRYETEKKIEDAKREAEIAKKEEEEAQKRKNNLQYVGIAVFIVILLLIIFASGRMNLSVSLASSLVFYTILLILQFFLLLMRPYLIAFVGGVPIVGLLTNMVVAISLPYMFEKLHQIFQQKVIKQKDDGSLVVEKVKKEPSKSTKKKKGKPTAINDPKPS